VTDNSNMPTLWQNCLMQYSTEVAQKAWVWFVETRGKGMFYEADKYANEVEELILKLNPMITLGGARHDASPEVLEDLMRFVLVRHANWRLGNNVRPPFLLDNSGPIH